MCTQIKNKVPETKTKNLTPKNKKTHQTKQWSPAIAKKIKSEFIEKLKQKA